MQPLQPGISAPAVPGLDFSAGPTVLVFYKVTCPVCQMAAPKLHVFERAYPGRVVGVGQDPGEKLEEFGRAYGMAFPWLSDLPPYEISNAFGVRVVPTVFLVSPTGRVLETVESWDRSGLNNLSKHLARLAGVAPVEVSTPSDGLPALRPG